MYKLIIDQINDSRDVMNSRNVTDKYKIERFGVSEKETSGVRNLVRFLFRAETSNERSRYTSKSSRLFIESYAVIETRRRHYR